MQPTEPRCLLQLRLLFEREAVNDAPAVAVVALDPKNGLREFLTFGWGRRRGNGRQIRRQIRRRRTGSIRGSHGEKRSELGD